MARRLEMPRPYDPKDWLADVRLMRDMRAVVKDINEGPPYLDGAQYATVDDAAATLGLSAFDTQTARDLIHDLATENRAALDVAIDAQKRGWSQYVVKAIVERAMALKGRARWAGPLAKSVPLPEGSVRVHGGKQVIKRAGEWVPVGSRDQAQPPAGQAGKIDQATAEAFRDLRARAGEAGYRITGKLQPGVTPEHLENLERAIADQAKADKADFKPKLNKAEASVPDSIRKARPGLAVTLTQPNDPILKALGLVKSPKKARIRSGLAKPAAQSED